MRYLIIAMIFTGCARLEYIGPKILHEYTEDEFDKYQHSVEWKYDHTEDKIRECEKYYKDDPEIVIECINWVIEHARGERQELTVKPEETDE